jgi:hypothetical protein
LEVIEHIFAFCSGKDLLRLTETCTTFKAVVSNSTRLMKKLKIVLELCKFQLGEEEAMKKCIETRKFSAACLCLASHLERLETFLSVIAKLGAIEDLAIHGSLFDINEIKEDQLLQLISLISKAKVCFIYDLSNVFSRLTHRYTFQPIQCDLLTDLQLGNGDVNFISQLLVGSKNLKRFSLDTELFTSKKFKIDGTTVWQLVSFQLESLEISAEIIKIDKTFKVFLANQVNLQEISIAGEDFDFSQLLEFSNIKRINVGMLKKNGVIFMSSIPHDQLFKFRLWWKQFQTENAYGKVFYTTEAPEDISEYQANIMRFLDSDTDTPGIKNGQVIASLLIGNLNWIQNGVAFSDEFIRDLINKIPNLATLLIQSAKTVEEIKESVLASGKEIRLTHVIGTDGNQTFGSGGRECLFERDHDSDSDSEDFVLQPLIDFFNHFDI